MVNTYLRTVASSPRETDDAEVKQASLEKSRNGPGSARSMMTIDDNDIFLRIDFDDMYTTQFSADHDHDIVSITIMLVRVLPFVLITDSSPPVPPQSPYYPFS